MESYKWERCNNYNELKEILEIVEPNIYDKEGIIKRYPAHYRAYVARGAPNSIPQIGAIAIAAFLPKSRTLHIEDFAIHPYLRGLGYARLAYSSWRAFVWLEWYEAAPAYLNGGGIMIEVYLHNVEAWRKIMGVTEVDVGSRQSRLLKKSTPIIVMGSNLSCPVAAYAEWQSFQERWQRDMKSDAKRLRLVSRL
jgi:hypothetical protein